MSTATGIVPGLPTQTFTPSSFLPQAGDDPVLSAGVHRQTLRKAYAGQPLDAVRTPAAIVDIGTVRRNCWRMLQTATQTWGVHFRAHVKTHKTPQVALLQLSPGAPLRTDQSPTPTGAPTTNRLVVSTFPEAWGLIDSSDQDGFVRDQLKHLVHDILYSLPLPLDKVDELFQLRLAQRRFSSIGKQAQIRLMVDDAIQVEQLERYMQVRTGTASAASTGSGARIPIGLTEDERALGAGDPWPVFIKIDAGGKRAGNPADSPEIDALLRSIIDSNHVRIYGFYAHAGQSYASKSTEQADTFLQTEVDVTSQAAGRALKLLAAQVPDSVKKARYRVPFVLAVGSTPTAHAALARARANKHAGHNLNGEVELHAGNFPFYDLQQVATKAIPNECETPDCTQGQGRSAQDVGFSVLSSVVSTYPSRPPGGEALCDAGGIAMSKDSGPFGSYGHVISPLEAIGWCIARPSQEHGMLTPRPGSIQDWKQQWDFPMKVVQQRAQKEQGRIPLQIGQKIRVLPQHACLTAAQYPWYYVVDTGVDPREDAWWSVEWPTLTVQDVYTPWKFW